MRIEYDVEYIECVHRDHALARGITVRERVGQRINELREAGWTITNTKYMDDVGGDAFIWYKKEGHCLTVDDHTVDDTSKKGRPA